MKKYFILCATAAFFVLTAPKVSAVDTLIFDSTDHYLGACQLTDTSTWTLPSDLEVTTFEVWYNWAAGEKELPVVVTKDGEPFADFTAVRTSCDTYQQNWCNADFAINKTFPAGTYTTKIPTAKQCLKPGGTGAIRLYSSEATTSTEVAVTSTQSVSTTQAPAPASKNSTECSGVSIKVVYALSGVIVVLLLVIYGLYKARRN